MGDYLPHTDTDRRAMLAALGVESAAALFDAVDRAVFLTEPLHLPAGVSEQEAMAKITALAAENRVYDNIFRGAGAYAHYIPACVGQIAQKEEFVTAYTPYQAELSQGILQAIFEYQSEIASLTGMDVANASVYDGACAAAEAVSMCFSPQKPRVLVCDTLAPDIIGTISTYFHAKDAEIVTVPHSAQGTADAAALAELLDERCCALVFASPNYYGCIEDAPELCAAAHKAGAQAIYCTNPIALAVLQTPGEAQADIAVGDGQPLGIPLSFGGPSLGYMACTEKLTRKLPGRIVGETVDADGARAFVLTIQAREQHIRREKALSNICSNEAHCALTAAVYLAALGAEGLVRVAVASMENARKLQALLSEFGFAPVFDAPYFHEFVTERPKTYEAVEKALDKAGILGALPIEFDGKSRLLWCATDLCGDAAQEKLRAVLSEVLS